MAFDASWVQKQLAERLTKLHDASGLSAEDVAGKVNIHKTTLQRILQAKMRVEPRLVLKLCRVYGLQDGDEINRLSDMAVASRTNIWWRAYESWLTSNYLDFVGYENEARICRSIHPTVIHGLLQTPQYLRAVIAEGNLPMEPDRVDALVEVRSLRQRRLVEPEPLQLEAFLGEPALHWAFGGRSVLHKQLVHLRGLVELPNVQVRIVGFGRPHNLYPLDLLIFEEDGAAVVFAETQFGNQRHDTEREVKYARRTLDYVRALALSAEESIALIDQRIMETAEQ